MTIQKIGSHPSLDDVTALLAARSGLRGAYNDMEDEVDKFVNSDVMFIERPRFYTELLTLTRTTGDAVDEALSMLKEYLCGICDVGGIFRESMATCLGLSCK